MELDNAIEGEEWGMRPMVSSAYQQRRRPSSRKARKQCYLWHLLKKLVWIAMLLFECRKHALNKIDQNVVHVGANGSE